MKRIYTFMQLFKVEGKICSKCIIVPYDFQRIRLGKFRQSSIIKIQNWRHFDTDSFVLYWLAVNAVTSQLNQTDIHKDFRSANFGSTNAAIATK